METDWQRQLRWDRYLAGRPKCLDCGEPVVDGECLVLEDGVLCERCLRRRIVWADTLENEE